MITSVAQSSYATVENRILVVNDLATFEMLETTWRDLFQNAVGERHVFGDHKWLRSFWRSHAGDDLKPIVLTTYDGNQLVAAWPLQVVRKSGVRVLQWLSTPIAQYGGPLIRRGHDVNANCWNILERLRELAIADCFQLSGLLIDAPYTTSLSNICGLISTGESFSLNTGQFADWDAYYASHKKSARRARRKRFHKFNRVGNVRFDVYEGGSKAKAGMSTALQWKRDWLKENQLPNAALEAPQFDNLLAGALESSDSEAQWVTGVLSLDDQPVAIEIGARHEGYYASFLSAYDRAYSQYSVGKIQLELMIKWAIENEIGTFDLLVNEGQYKADWTDTTDGVVQLGIAFNSFGKLYSSVWLKRLRPAAKRGFERLGTAKRQALLDLLPG